MSYQEAAASQTNSTITSALRLARKVVVAVIGTSLLAIGVALIVLPGPAVLVIPLGLAILGTEFLWARRLLRRVKQGMACSPLTATRTYKCRAGQVFTIGGR
jgi:uncharacterized protein (TIGR02611 family)